MSDAEKYLLQAKGALASLKSFVADVTVAVEVATSKVETALALVQEETPVCDMCNDEIDEPAALVFSPPENHVVRKYHVCDMCWLALREHFHGR